MHAPVRNVLVASAFAVSVAPACLGTLPDAVQCPPAAVYAFCPSPQSVGTSTPNPPSPTPGGPVLANCNLAGACLVNQGRACACTSAAECQRTSTTCSPAPDCPKSIADAASGATCIEMTGAFVPSASAPGCVCGCPSCAMFCDGQGPVFGSDQTLRLTFPSALPSSGRLGVMVRVRGSGPVIVNTESGGAERPLGQAPANPEFRETVLLADPLASSWSNDAQRPNAIMLHSLDGTVVEVDCIVPFLLR